MLQQNQAASFYSSSHFLSEYALVAHPDEELNQKLREEKKSFDEVYQLGVATNTPPHIVIASFLAKEAMEATLVRWIGNICALHAGFTATLNNYSGIPSHAIYLRIQDPQPFRVLANRLKIFDGFIQSNDCPALNTVARPHLAIAEGLTESVYSEAIREYARKSFHESFAVKKISLFKKEDDCRKTVLVNSFILSA
ncbi:MAG: 2'-5' RNA ligase family protein [Flavisolibacter sp.]